MAAKRLAAMLGALMLIVLSMSLAAWVQPTPPVNRIALLAPFEGRYSEIGYDLLYAMRLALKDGDYQNIELLPIDDGNHSQAAREHALALARNPQVKLVIVAGNAATAPETLQAFDDLGVMVIGHWAALTTSETVFSLTSPHAQLPTYRDILDAAQQPAPLTGGEMLALKQFPLLRESLDEVTIISSSQLPDATFTARYLASDQFVPPPGLLVTLGYDSAHLAAQAIESALAHHQPITRATVIEALRTQHYIGINGDIRFNSAGYWEDAPQYTYRYDAERRLYRVN